MTRLVPIVTERGIAEPTDSAIDRLNRSVIEAAKQCGRNRLMLIAKPQAWDTWVSDELNHVESRCLVAHPNGKPLAALDLSTSLPTQLAIGPEGGFTDAEIAAALDHGWQSVHLGERILRVETAAVAMAAVVALSARS